MGRPNVPNDNKFVPKRLQKWRFQKKLISSDYNTGELHTFQYGDLIFEFSITRFINFDGPQYHLQSTISSTAGLTGTGGLGLGQKISDMAQKISQDSITQFRALMKNRNEI